MAGRGRRAVLLGGGLLAVLLFVAAAAGPNPRPAGRAAPPAVRVLQLNLCNSGIAECYTGRSVRRAVQVIRAVRPDIVTLDEICADDLSVLAPAMGLRVVASGFRPALDRRTGGPFRCRDGRPYGIGLLARRSPSNRGFRFAGGVFPTQDGRDPEERVWLCGHGPASYFACVTHLASTSTTVALAQCRYLLDDAIPSLRRDDPRDPVVLGADLNLRSAVGLCLPRGYRQAGDGGVQHVVTAGGLTIGSRRTIGMDGTTDHPGLVVDLVRPAP